MFSSGRTRQLPSFSWQMKIPLLSFCRTRLLNKLILMKSSWQILLKWKMPGSEKTLWKKYGDPWAASDKKHILSALFLWEFRQQPCLPVHGYALNYLQAMRTSSSYLSWYSAHWVSCRSSVWRYAVFRTSVFPIYTTGDFSAFFLLATRPAPNFLAMSFLPPVSQVCSFFAAVILLAFIPGQKTKNKYGPVPK